MNNRLLFLFTISLISLIIVEVISAQIPPESSIPENLGPNVNSVQTELAPVLSPDGNVLFFTTYDSSTIEGQRGKYLDLNVWYSELQPDNSWSVAKKLSAPINTIRPDALFSISSDGKQMLLLNTNKMSGRADGVSCMKKINGKWSDPEKLDIDGYVNVDQSLLSFSFADTGKTLLLSIDEGMAVGKKDIYVSFIKPNGKWTKPLNLGQDINTDEDEVTPFLTPDGSTLYFSSRRFEAFGGYDVYMSKRLDTSWTHWSKPINLGSAVNTTGDEFYYSISPLRDYAYFVYRPIGPSFKHDKRDILGKADIYRISLVEKPKPAVNIIIKGVDKETGAPVDVKVTITIPEDSTYEKVASTVSSEGVYAITLPAGKKYAVHAEAEKYYDQYTKLDLSQYSENADYSLNFYLVNLITNKPIRIDNIYFETGSSVLLSESFNALDSLVVLFRDNPNLNISIAGHTDNVGSEASNVTLSDGRAKSVLEYLVKQGVEEQRISSKGFGSTMPVSANTTPEGRQHNRRVEFTVIKK